MDTVKKKSALVGLMTLIVGLAVGLGIGVWSVKSSQASNAPEQQTATPKKSTEWDPFQQMDQMRQDIDRAIRRATEQFEANPSAAWLHPNAGYSSSFDLQDRGDHYELHAYLPDVKASDVNVKIDNERTVHVSVTQRKEETKNTSQGNASFKELGKYEQVVTLPEPVRSSEMKIDKHDHEVVITIPKASTSSA